MITQVKSNKLNIFVCLTCGITILGLIVFPMGADNLIKNITSLNIKWILAALACMIAFWLLESLALHILIKSAHKNQTFFKSLSVNMGGQYFHSITPFASGGQPFQAYYLNKQGIELGVAINCLVTKFIIYQLALVVVSAVLLILRFAFFREYINNFSFLAIIGFIINLVVMLWAISLVFFKKTTRRIATFIIKFLAKIHIVKNSESKIDYLDSELEKFNSCFHEMIKDIPSILKAFVVSVCHLFAYMAVPYMIYRAFGLSSVDLLTIISAQAFVMLISSFIPIPGAGVGAEGAFYLFFNRFFPAEGQIGIAIVLWRLITFYFTVLVGVFFTFGANKKTSEPEN